MTKEEIVNEKIILQNKVKILLDEFSKKVEIPISNIHIEMKEYSLGRVQFEVKASIVI